ncbi:MAG TPA: pilus assembly protein N-terminal domain-containing protein [Stellaceae bacterium]|nr:pilus assembly protein N-terminal domain-containing protein [Stellaceae bacterium]
MRGRARWAGFATLVLAAPAAAEQAPLRVTVDHAAVIALDGDAAVVLIADPAVADVVSERPRLVFVLGRRPGTTNLLVYDGAGKRLVGREVVVVPPDARTVTITRETDQTDYSCNPRCAFREHLPGPSQAAAAAAAPSAAMPPVFSTPSSAPPPAIAAPPPAPITPPSQP